MNLDQEVSRAREAQRWLDDPLFIAAKDDVYGQLRAARQAASTTDTALHSKLILMEQMADKFFDYFRMLADTGKFAQVELNTIEARKRGFAERMASYVSMGRNGL